MKNRQYKGFTLIELLVVIAIIALMLSILVPTLRLAKDHARRVDCISNQRQLALATHAYTLENNEFLPLAATQYESPQTAMLGKVGPPTWDERLWPYIDGDKRIFACRTIGTESDIGPDYTPRTYTINALITGLDDLESLFAYSKSYRLIDITQPSMTLLYGEHFWPSWVGNISGAVFHNWSLVRPIHHVRYSSRTFESPWDPEGAHEAHGITTFTFVDGHTEALETQYTRREGNPLPGVKFHP